MAVVGGTSAFVGLGSTGPDPSARLAAGIRRLEAAGVRVAAVARTVVGPFVRHGAPDPHASPVHNTVAEVVTDRTAEAFLALLLAIESQEGRDRADPDARALDLDLLTFGDLRLDSAALKLPHPRALERAFVLAPWEEIAPLAVVPGTGRTVVELAARLRARDAQAFERLVTGDAVTPPPVGTSVEVLGDRDRLARWRRDAGGLVGVAMTMGALHEGHASLVRRARAECDAVLATIFVNPLQFGPSEDLQRYPRTLEKDLEVLAAAGAHAVYVPTVGDLYPPGFSTGIEPDGPARDFEGSLRPGHFRGVATVVAKLWLRTRPDRAYFGQKDAQQVAVLRRVAKDLDLPGTLVTSAIVRAPDGLALSSRNRYLTPEEREQALSLPRSLAQAAGELAAGERVDRVVHRARERMASGGLRVDYGEVVDPDSFLPVKSWDRPALLVAAARAGGTRLLDNRWVVEGGGVAP